MAYTIREKARRGGSVQEDGSRRYVREFGVEFDEDEATSDPAAVLLLTGIPKYADYYLPTDLSARCTGVDPEMDGQNPRFWKVRCTYTNKFSASINALTEDETHPLLRPAKVRRTSVRATKVFPYDLDLKPYMTVLGEPLESPPPRVYSQLRVVITRNEASFNLQKPYLYANKTNLLTWYGFPAGKVLCEEIAGEDEWWFDLMYAVVTYSFLIDEFGHDAEVLHAGTWYLTAGGVQAPVQIGGVITSTRQPLKADGTLVGAGEDPVYLPFRQCQQKDFTGLYL